MYGRYIVKNVKRIRVDEITQEMVQKLGYTSKEILKTEMGLQNTKKLYYYIELKNEKCNCSHEKTNTTSHQSDKTIRTGPAKNTR